MKRRLLVARFYYEGNSFGPLPADRSAFERTEWHAGQQALERAVGSGRELAALPGFAARHPEWTVLASRCAAAVPSGPIDDAVFDELLAAILCDTDAALAGGGLDGIYLSLHGAAMTRARPHPDLDLVAALRQRCPRVPIAASFDMHANHHPRLAELLTVGCGYRTHPHVDLEATATRALEALHRCVAGGIATRGTIVNRGLLLPSINMRTADGPMRALQAAAEAAERRPGVLAASLFGGFPYADTAHTGASVMVYTDAAADPDGALSRRIAGELDARLCAAEPEFHVRLPGPAEGIAQALASRAPGLIAVTDAADNPYSGGAADTPGLLPALLAAAPTVPCVFATFADGGVVAQAKAAGIGNPFATTLGARHGTAFGAPVPVRVVPLRYTDGRYRFTAALFRGAEIDCGASVVLAIA
ncbi:MAG: M81 family metallopeptidase, partial [Lautropia sp.]